MFFRRGREHGGTAPAAPLVTPFSFPCGRDFFDFKFQQEPYFKKHCAPPNFSQYWWSTVGYYSPAVCPKGYTVGCSRWHEDQGPTVEATETAVQCVPTGYSCADNPSVAFSATHKAVMIQIRWAQTDLKYFETHPLVPGAAPTAVKTLPVELRDAYVPKRPELRDVPVTAFQGFAMAAVSGFETTYPTEGYTTNAPPADTTAPDILPGDTDLPGVDSPGSRSSNRGLTVGARAGIGVGVTLLFSFIAAIVWFILWKRRRNQQHPQTQPEPLQPSGMAELGGQPKFEPVTKGQEYPPGSGFHTASPTVVGSELDTSTPRPTISEAWGSPRPTELDAISPSPYHELPHHSYIPPAELGTHPTSIPEIPGATYQPPYSQVQPPPWTPHASPPIDMPSPDPQVAIMPEEPQTQPSPPAPLQSAYMQPASSSQWEPSADEMSHLVSQHAQLEAKKQRLLEVQKIEEEQAALQQRIQSMHQGQQGGGSSRPAGQ